MSFTSWLRSSQSHRSDSGRARRSSLRPALEMLETRLCPSNTYHYKVVAHTGQAGISDIRQFPSINDSGQVAFIAALAAGGEAVFVGDASSPDPNDLPVNLSGPGSANTTYLASAQINNAGKVLATQRNF